MERVHDLSPFRSFPQSCGLGIKLFDVRSSTLSRKKIQIGFTGSIEEEDNAKNRKRQKDKAYVETIIADELPVCFATISTDEHQLFSHQRQLEFPIFR
jgi:hypothetical protein